MSERTVLMGPPWYGVWEWCARAIPSASRPQASAGLLVTAHIPTAGEGVGSATDGRGQRREVDPRDRHHGTARGWDDRGPRRARRLLRLFYLVD